MLKTDSGHVVLGRVIRTDAYAIGATNAVLIYLFNTVDVKKILSSQSYTNLLVAPIITGYELWSRGFAVLVQASPLRKDQVLDVHCFYNQALERYFDDQGRELGSRVEPCGDGSFVFALGISKRVDAALSIPPRNLDIHG